MTVSAISSAQGFTGRTHKRDRIDNAILRDDKEIRDIAYDYAIKRDQKRKKNINRLWNSVPLVAAASAGILTKGNSALFGKEVSGLAARTLNAAKAGGYWAMLLGIAEGINIASNTAYNNSKTVRNFENNHPFLSMLGRFGTFIGALVLLPQAASKAYKMIKPEYIARAGQDVGEIAEHINKIHLPEKVKGFKNTVLSHIPQTIKDITKGIISWAPDLTALAAFFTTINARANSVTDYNKVYLTLKGQQLNLAQARIKEIHNDKQQ